MTVQRPSHSPAGVKGRRRFVVASLAGGAALAGMGTKTLAQGLVPGQPIKVVVPFGPGGLGDITTRLVAERLGELLTRQTVVENKPGAGGVVAATYVLSAAPQSHTFILFSNGTTISKTLIKLPFDPQSDFLPVTTMAYFDLNILTKAGGPLTSLEALLKASKTRQLTLGTINPGSTQHLSAELFKSVAGLNAITVPFKTSGDVQLAIQRGDVDAGFESYAAARGSLTGGKLIAVATTGPNRTPWLPQVPTVQEAGVPGYEVTGWNAIYAPKGTAEGVIEAVGQAVRTAIAEPKLRDRMLQLGVVPGTCSPKAMAELFERDRMKWQKVIQSANIKA